MAHSKPGLRDWALLTIGVLFVAAGLFILPRDRDRGIITVAFFGCCTLVFAGTIVRKLRARSMEGLKAEILGGVPIRPSRARLILSAGATLALGAALIVFGGSYPPLFRAIAWLTAAVGLALLGATAAGWLPVGYLRFDPEGLTIGRRGWRYTVPWDAIARIEPGELHDNPVLWLRLHRFDLVTVEPPRYAALALAQFSSNERWTGAHVVIMTSKYGLELPLLVSALRRYVEDPASRASLGTRVIAA